LIFGREINVADIWDIDRLRHGNKIDATAMIRRGALLIAGGYPGFRTIQVGRIMMGSSAWECEAFSFLSCFASYRRHDQ